MFRNVRQGSVLYFLDTKEYPKYYTGIIKSVSEPYFPSPQNGQIATTYERYVNVIVDVNGSNVQYGVPENLGIISKDNITVACTQDLLSNEVHAILQSSTEALKNVEKNKKNVAECEKILKELNPTYAKTQEQDEKLNKLETQVSNLDKTLSGLGNQLNDVHSMLKKIAE